MPCSYYTPEEERQMAYAETRKLAKQVNELTRMLCGLMHKVENGYSINFESIEGLPEWWKDHQEHDRKAGRRK